MSPLSTFAMPTRLILGQGVLSESGNELRALGAGSVLLVSDAGIAAAGILAPCLAALARADLRYTIFTDVEANPGVETVQRALAMYTQNGCDALLAVGGGSPMDVAKATGLLAANGGDIRAYEGSGKVTRPLPPLVAVPTTAGTGSEVTFFTVITDPDRQFKMPIISPLLAPRLALLDPDMVAGLPPGLVATTGMDALTHAVESYLSKMSHAFSEAQALRAIELIGANLLAAVAGDRTARGEMLFASTLAGMAFNSTRLGVCHAMAHPLGGVCGMPHGLANAILLPVTMEYNLPNARARLARISLALGANPGNLTESEAAQAAVDAVRRLADAAGIPQRLSLARVTESSIPRMAADAMTSGNIAVNPRPTQLEDVISLYQAAL
jgi:alcohol dehydrogenase class IV